MSFLLWILLGAAAGYTALGLLENDNDDTTDTVPEPVSPPAPPVGEAGDDMITYVTDGLMAEGGDGSDVYLFDPSANGDVAATLDGAGGDDLFIFAGFTPAIFSDGQISGGDGNDSITVAETVFSSTIAGGAGDDSIDYEGVSGEIFGDDGNDVIRMISRSGDVGQAYGGAGNDTLDGTGSDNVQLWGGVGDDVILTNGHTDSGAGYIIHADGGVGNDTLTHTIEVFPLPPQNLGYLDVPPRLTGGEGADHFKFVLTQGSGSFSPSPDDPPVFVNEAGTIADFAQGVDQIEIDLSGSIGNYMVESGTLIEDTTDGRTEIMIRLTSNSLPDQDIRIVVATTGLGWSDINFTGTPPGSSLMA